MFRKKKGDDEDMADLGPEIRDSGDMTAPPLKPFTRRGTHGPAKLPGPAAPAAPARPAIPRRAGEAPSALRRLDRSRPGDADAGTLTVGREICLSGEITSCMKLIVEGRVEATLTDAQAIDVAETGFFKGTAEVEEADISGLFEGELVARDRLTVQATGRIKGSIRYGRIVIEAGGQISGDMQALPSTADEAPEPGPFARPSPSDFPTGGGSGSDPK